MKIHIIGGPGSGKSFLAERFSKQFGIPHYDLDELQWDNQANDYGTKRAPQERDLLLNRILQEENWVIEGVYYAWCGRCFEEADTIYLLSVPRRTYRYRILRRFFRRKLGLEKGKKETLSSLSKLLKWADQYQSKNLIEIRKLLVPYRDKVVDLSLSKSQGVKNCKRHTREGMTAHGIVSGSKSTAIERREHGY